MVLDRQRFYETLKELEGQEVALFMALLLHADAEQECYPSRRLLAEETKLSERHMVTLRASLYAKEIVNLECRGGGRLSNRYKILPPVLAQW